MEFFRNLKIGMKLMFVVLSVVVMTAFLGVFSVIQLSKVNDVTVDITGNWMPSIQFRETGCPAFRPSEKFPWPSI